MTVGIALDDGHHLFTGQLFGVLQIMYQRFGVDLDPCAHGSFCHVDRPLCPRMTDVCPQNKRMQLIVGITTCIILAGMLLGIAGYRVYATILVNAFAYIFFFTAMEMGNVI